MNPVTMSHHVRGAVSKEVMQDKVFLSFSHQILEKICRLMKSERALLWIKSKNGVNVLVDKLGFSGSPVRMKDLNLPRGVGLISRMEKKKRVAIIEDVKADIDVHHRDFVEKENLRRMLYVPIVIGGSVLGSVAVFLPDKARPEGDMLSMVEAYGRIVGSVVGDLLVIRDSTLSKDKLSSLTSETLQSTKASFSKYLGSVVNHEVKNLLNVINTKIDLIATDESLARRLGAQRTAELRQIRNKIKQTVSITKTVSELLYEDGAGDVKTDVSLHQATETAKSLLSEKLDKYNIDVDIDIRDSYVIPHARFFDIVVIFFNLISNSLKAILRKGGNSDPLGFISISAKTKGRHIVVSVADTGIGIDKREIPNIFLAGYTSDDREGSRSSGLGLFGIKRLVEDEYSGTVHFKSKYMEGTEFFVRLPFEEIVEDGS